MERADKDSVEFDYTQLSKSVKETKRRAYDEGLMFSVLERMADLETEVEELRRDLLAKDNYNKERIQRLVNVMKKFARKLKIRIPIMLDQSYENKNMGINEEDDE